MESIFSHGPKYIFTEKPPADEDHVYDQSHQDMNLLNL